MGMGRITDSLSPHIPRTPASREFEICIFQFAIFNNWPKREDLTDARNVLQIQNCKFQIVN
jgi:hypothetical protein